MLTDSQRVTLTARLRRGRGEVVAEIPRRAPGRTDLPLSYGQEQLWFLDRFAPGLAAYNVPNALELSGPLDVAALGRALDALVARHEALRTRLAPSADGHPVQMITPPGPVRIETVDLSAGGSGPSGSGPSGSGVSPGDRVPGDAVPPLASTVDTAREERADRLRTFIATETVQPFSLADGPLLRVYLLKLADREHMLLVVVHHAVFDGWSADVMVRELAALYGQEAAGVPAGLAELPVQFADYALWERDRLDGGAVEELEGYWRQALDGFETVQFPVDRSRPLVDSFEGGLAQHMTSEELLSGIQELSRQEGATLFATLMAGLYALLWRYTGQTDLVVGTVSANRSRRGLSRMIGFLANVLPVRCDLSGDPAFTELLARVREATTGAYAHQELPFGKLVETLHVERDPSRAPVFQIALVSAERDVSPLQAAGVTFGHADLVVGIDAAKFDLSFVAEARGGRLWLDCSYKTRLLDAETVQRVLRNFETLLRGAVADPSAPLSRLPVLTARELDRELSEWNDTAAPRPAGCVHQAFEAQVARDPGAVAAEFEGERVSYGGLNVEANRIARRLREAGVGPETLVGVCMHTSVRRLAVMLGVWKAGGGYVPLDPHLPAERLGFIMADTEMPVVVTDAASEGAIPARDAGIVVSLDREAERIAGLDGGNLADTGVIPADVAYVIYTSGSTGEPKGVVVEHRQALNFLLGMAERWRIGPGSAVLSFAAFTFDASVMDMFMPLLGGARVVLASAATLHSPPRLATLIREAGVTFALLPPTVLSLLAGEEFPGLRTLLSGGEELPAEVARRWLRPGLRLVNAYGPTEATVIATYQELDGGSYPPPIGLPTLPNYQAYVLDGYLNPLPPGVLGELHVGGAGVARGYLNRPALTAQRFVADPFSKQPGARLYKTGDVVRRRPDGSIVYVGRIDGQVKIRGLRIELGEIEAALATCPGVAQAVVTVVADPGGDKQLAGYLRARADAPLAGADVRQHLADRLPGYMIPEHLVFVDEFPLNSSGKIDKSALPAPRAQPPAERVAPATLIETIMASLYATLLDLEEVGATDSFFDLGGNSLKVMRLIRMMDDELDVDVNVASVFLAPTPRQLAALLRDKHGFEDEELGADGIGGLADMTGLA